MLLKLVRMLFVCLIATGIRVDAGEVAGRKMAWAHYVPWFKPENASLTTEFLYNCPMQDVPGDGNRESYYRSEIAEARRIGIDGFFIDQGANRNRPVNDWDLTPYLDAAKGMDFQIGICLDGYDNIPHLVGEFTRMLKTYGNHPNYPRYNGKYVIATYAYWRWKPEEWRQLRDGLKKAGFELFIIANVDPGVLKSIDAKQLSDYADAIDCAYMFGAPGINNEHPEENNRILNEFARSRGKLFMPCLHPGYYGAWLKSGNDFYQPFAGVDMLYETFLSALELQTQWVHVTTWNDLIETALMARTFTFGLPRVLEYYLSVLKGEEKKFPEPELIFAYHREEQPGTLLRLEVMNLPSVGDEKITVDGNLLDLNGKPVFRLAPKRFVPGRLDRAEWLVSTTDLARSPVLVPEFRVTAGGNTRVVRTPAVFLVSSWLQNAVTVNVPLSGLVEIRNSLRISWKEGQLAATMEFDSPEEIKQAVLFKNDRPIALFSPDLKEGEVLLSCKLSQVDKELDVTVKNGRILRAVKNYEKNGCPWFQWNGEKLKTTSTPRWSVIGVTFAGSPGMEITAKKPGSETFTVSVSELIRSGEAGTGIGRFYVLPEMTLRNADPLKRKSGQMELSLFARRPRPADSFYVRYETMSGKVGFSEIQYPFAEGNPVEERSFIETPVNLETWSGSIGWCRRDRSEFLTPESRLPVRKTRVVKRPLSLLTERALLYHFDGNGEDALGFYRLNVPENLFVEGGFDGKGGALKFTGKEKFPMRFRVWPGSTATIRFQLNPAPWPGKPQSVIFNQGWTDGISVNLTADGRIEAVRSFLVRDDTANETKDYERLVSKGRLTPGKWSEVEIVANAGSMSIYVDGNFDCRTRLRPVRSIGNCKVMLGGGMPDYENYTGLLDELSVSGLGRKE
ncbi:endo-1,3-alpha-glucanase family glycosylhydrolase [uncultured Victivallis sp.]|uniref:endo-1,3-alpha-glucanase family glycosylhydrolase n=1 Tax=uncultured Victivallis sp. TaxID=354118 RepID=UPI0025F34F10|nr:endo-1,3-alpha-glucanase family glycosylhydrolase [uncultured Victivallis sp.]